MLKVANQDVSGFFMLREGVEIVAGLLVGTFKVATGALLFDDQHAWPEQVDKALAVVQFRNMLFVASYVPPSNSKNVEEFVIEGLCLTLLVGRIVPFSGEIDGTITNLVPRKTHLDSQRKEVV